MATTRRAFLASLPAFGAALSRAAAASGPRHIRWAVSSGLWRHVPHTRFTDILDVMRDTGFEGVRFVDFPGCLTEYNLTEAIVQREVSRRNLHVATVSWHGRLQDPASRREDLESARRAMKFLADLGASQLVVFPPSRTGPGADTDAGFREMCARCEQVGDLAREMGFTAGLHNHLDTMVQNQDEVDRFLSLVDPKRFGFSPDTAHLDLAGCDVVGTLEKSKDRIRFLDYKDAKWTTPDKDWVEPDGTVLARDSASARFYDSIYDLGDGEVDFPACHRVLKSAGFDGWICVDLDTARHGPLASYRRCRAYIEKKLDPIYT